MKKQQNEEVSLMNVLTVPDVKIMKEQPWWAACQITPFIVKGAIVGDNYILIVTNLRRTWVCKAGREQIQSEKKRFNSTIETNTFAGICELLEQVITKQNIRATYTFELQETFLILNFHSVIKIYPLKWTFILSQVKDSETFDFICEDLINPLVCTVKSLERRCLHYQEALLNTERELLKRMNEREKAQFKSKALEGEDEWRQQTEDTDFTNLKITSFEMGPQAHYFIRFYTLSRLLLKEREAKKRNVAQPHQQPQRGLNSIKSEQKKLAILDAYEQSLNDLFGGRRADAPMEVADELVPKAQTQKRKERKKDFL